MAFLLQWHFGLRKMCNDIMAGRYGTETLLQAVYEETANSG